ncbi:hypothetical protein Tco_1027315, partial [Tanacetum coccineum]
NVNGETESDNDGDDFVYPNLSTYKADDQEEEKENDDDDVSSNQMVLTPLDYETTEDKENKEDDDNVMGGEQEDEEDEELYRDLNLNLDRRDAEMTDAQNNQETEEVHVTLTIEPLVVQPQSSSVSSDLVSKFINPSSDTGAKVLAISSNQPQTSYDLFASYGDVVTLKRGRDDQDKDEEPSAGSNRGTKRRRSGKEESSKEATQRESKSTSSYKGASRSQLKSSGKSTQAEEYGPRVDDLEEPLHQEFNTRNDDVSPVRKIIAIDERLWNPSGSQTPDREWNKINTIDDRPTQSWMNQLA